MKKIWIKLLEEFVTKDDKGEDVKLEVGKTYEVEESFGESLITLKKAEKAEAPSEEFDMEETLKSFSASLEKNVTGIMTKAFEGVNDTLEKSVVHAVPKGEWSDLEKTYGFKSDEHFFALVKAASGHGSADIPGMEFLHKSPEGVSINNDESLGFQIPEPVSGRIWTNAENEPMSLLARSDKYTTAGNSIKFNTEWETSRKEGKGQRNSGIIAYWEDEADEHTKSKPTTGKDSLELNKLSVLTYATEEYLEDSGNSFGAQITPKAGAAINYKINEAFFDGTGVGKPQGFMNGDALVVISATNNNGRNITHRNLNQMYWRNSNRNNAIWLVHPLLAEEMEFIYFNDDVNNQRPVYLPMNQITGAPFGTMYGRPVMPFEFMNSAGDLGDIAFIDASEMASLTKPGARVKSASSIHVQFLTDQVAYKWTFRVGGKPKWKAPKEDLKGTLKRSPYITLADRTAGGTSSGL